MEEDRLINRLGMSGLGHGVAVYRGATFENLSFNTFTYQFNNAFGLDTKIVFEDERSRREISPADGLSVFQHVANIITKVQRTALLPEPDVLLLSQEFEDQSDAEKPIPFLGVLVGGANNAMGCLYHVDWPNKTCFEKRMEYTNFVFLPALRVSINKNKKKDLSTRTGRASPS